ncbi:MAG: YlbF family regulator [Firmicutes bacterium]|nr:YlbF family regulator [Bacillota bacterium]
MSGEIYDCVCDFKNVLIKSQIYKDYLSAKNCLDEDSRDLLNEYKKQIRIKKNDFEHEKYVSNLYAKLMLIESARKFFKAESELINCIKEIYIKISEDINIDVFD